MITQKTSPFIILLPLNVFPSWGYGHLEHLTTHHKLAHLIPHHQRPLKLSNLATFCQPHSHCINTTLRTRIIRNKYKSRHFSILCDKIYLTAKRSDHISPVLHKLHWLPVPSRIKFKISTITFKILKFQQPACIFHLIDVFYTFLQAFSNPSTKISSSCRISHQKWAAYLFPLLHLTSGTLPQRIRSIQIHYCFPRST